MWVRTSNLLNGYPLYNALMAKLADAQDLKSCVPLDVWVQIPVSVYDEHGTSSSEHEITNFSW